MNRPTRPHRLLRGALTALALVGALASTGSQAALLDIANVPLSASLALVKPNIMFILDDSGSMRDSFMPDEVDTRAKPSGRNTNLPGDTREFENYGYYSSQCNGLAFDPTLTYEPPVRADGTPYPDILGTYGLTGAPEDGFDPASTRRDLSGRFYYRYTGQQPRLAWRYQSVNGTTDVVKDTFYAECTAPLGNAAADAVFQKLLVSNATATLKTRYANWFSYYRARRLLMRTAVGHAFKNIGDAYRVGFTVISDPKIRGSQFLDVDDFTTAQRTRFYELLYSAGTDYGFTPLRGALSKVGRYYGKRMPDQTHDPMRYSCQRNYALLSTDGYWNIGQSGYDGQETASYGPLALDGSPIGNQDGREDRPRLDVAGALDSLADVAQYYWVTDLRTEPSMPDKQNLVTYTLGLGVRGTLTWTRDYETQASGDFYDLVHNRKNWPVPTGTVTRSNNVDATHIDDLWHAAVNGRGRYFSALDPASLSDAISTMLSEISKEAGSGAGAAASTLTPVSGDRWFFLPSYSNINGWHGDLRAFQFKINENLTLEVPDTSDGKEQWSAAARLDRRTTSRRILFGNASRQLVDFTYANLQAAGYGSYFNIACPAWLSQCSRLSTAAAAKVTGDNLVKFLAGDTSLYLNTASADNQVFRARASRLGDFVNASPVYLSKPPFRYIDAGYAQFVTAQAQRRPMVYAVANDGMLHAFQVGESATDPNGGDELWAFVPRGVMPHLWRLADANYDSDHRNLLDATPTIGDVQIGGRWRTILVGGMGGGGRYYYALDITDPLNPSLLWEFSDANLGLTYGNPVITKEADGTWVVAFTSGYNNVGDGRGHLFVLDAATGSKIGEAVTPAGSTTTPSNLGRLNAWVVSNTDNTALRFYAGDMLGNLWRFQKVGGSYAAQLLGRALADDGVTPQPIVSKPVLTELMVNGTPVAIVAFGTGRLINTGDLASTTLQSIYAVKDALNDTSLGPLRNPAAALVREQLGSDRRLVNPQPIDWRTHNGWYVDLDQTSGERITLDGIPLGSGLIAFVSTVPNSDPCSTGGRSYLYQFQMLSGTIDRVDVSDSLIVGAGRVIDSAGLISAFVTTRNQRTALTPAGKTEPKKSNTLRRTAWRELQ